MNQAAGIVIIDGKVYSTQIQREIEGSELLNLVQTTGVPAFQADADPLPDHTRWAFQTPNTINYVIEIKPAILPLKHENWRRAYRVSFPWQYFVLSFVKDDNHTYWYMNEPALAWAKGRVNSLTAGEIIRPSLPNVYENGFKVCIGTTAPDSTLSPYERVNDFISGFYTEGSEFNDDLPWTYPGNYLSILDWVRDSRRDSFCWRNWPEFIYPSRKSLTDLLYSREYDNYGNRIVPIDNLDQLVNQAMYIGRRPW